MSRWRALRAVATLGRWLGPWAGPTAVAGGVVREVVRARSRVHGAPREVRAYYYEPEGREPVGAYLVAPGLHFLGPDDPRLDRFCRALAASGFLVMAPFLPAFLALTISPSSGDDLAVAFDVLERRLVGRGLARPAVFSISFGSEPALDLAARPSHVRRVGALVLFGGFCDFESTVRFAVTGVAEHRGRTHRLTRDPLNAPVVYLNILDHLDVREGRSLLADAWREMVLRTWGRMELKAEGARDPIALDIAGHLPAELRETFLMGCGLRPGGVEALSRAFAAAGAAFGYMDARPKLARVRAPVLVVHGRSDDVIPYFEAEKLVAALPAHHPHRLHLTGLYEHTGAGMPRPSEALEEGRTMVSMLRDLVDAPRGGLRFD